MAYDRRNLNLYHRGGGGGNPLSSSYRNKAILIVGATALYTAFLYNSGMFGQLFLSDYFVCCWEVDQPPPGYTTVHIIHHLQHS